MTAAAAGGRELIAAGAVAGFYALLLLCALAPTAARYQRESVGALRARLRSAASRGARRRGDLAPPASTAEGSR